MERVEKKKAFEDLNVFVTRVSNFIQRKQKGILIIAIVYAMALALLDMPMAWNAIFVLPVLFVGFVARISLSRRKPRENFKEVLKAFASEVKVIWDSAITLDIVVQLVVIAVACLIGLWYFLGLAVAFLVCTFVIDMITFVWNQLAKDYAESEKMTKEVPQETEPAFSFAGEKEE